MEMGCQRGWGVNEDQRYRSQRDANLNETSTGWEEMSTRISDTDLNEMQISTIPQRGGEEMSTRINDTDLNEGQISTIPQRGKIKSQRE